MLTLHSTADAARGAYLLLSDVCTGSFGKTGPAPVSLGPPCLDHANTCSNCLLSQYFIGSGVTKHSKEGMDRRAPVPVVHKLLQLLQHLLHLWNCASAVDELADLWMGQLIGCDERQKGNGLAGACWHLCRDEQLSNCSNLCTWRYTAGPAECVLVSLGHPCSPPGDTVRWRPAHD